MTLLNVWFRFESSRGGSSTQLCAVKIAYVTADRLFCNSDMSLLLRTTTANNFTFEYFLLGFRHSLMQCNNNKIKQRSYCPTFMLSSSACTRPSVLYQSPSNSNFGHIVVIELSRCCCWILWLDVPIGKWQQQLLLPCNIFQVNTLACVPHDHIVDDDEWTAWNLARVLYSLVKMPNEMK
jgi:hypothetical protein